MTETERRHTAHSPRPGFTLIGGLPTRVGPIVVRIDGTWESFYAMRSAAQHAMSRSCGLVVLEQARLRTGSSGFVHLDDRERSAALGILRNSHVSLLTVDNAGLHDLVEQCERLEASLLVLNPTEVESLRQDLPLIQRLLTAHFDLLMVNTVNSMSIDNVLDDQS